MAERAGEAPLLEKRPSTPAQDRTNTIRAIITVLLIVGIFGFLTASVSRIAEFLHTHPHLQVLFPIIGAACVISVIPLGVYLTFQNEFPNVNPIIPTHYFYLAKRCFKALQENNGKVTGKDL
ncbi:hypothetical protein CVIRNUC_000512 [Coccomyxa viridis]|uniref:Uncharacterized protein n=1 Tax=Coccomyxa viridis TaxID=1274662 RepID=A0AAV1HT93_9CHLO|nr:hypothetical protein CVIRNUC_000512 [Coccomyxa viridis]